MAASNRQDTMQRIQVGIVGLVAVLLLVSVANFVLQRASEEQSAIEEIQAETIDGSRAITNSEDAAAPPSEPLVELGIQPAPAPDDAEEDKTPVSKRPAPKAQVVPDLKPDPKLDAPMDRER